MLTSIAKSSSLSSAASSEATGHRTWDVMRQSGWTAASRLACYCNFNKGNICDALSLLWMIFDPGLAATLRASNKEDMGMLQEQNSEVVSFRAMTS